MGFEKLVEEVRQIRFGRSAFVESVSRLDAAGENQDMRNGPDTVLRCDFAGFLELVAADVELGDLDFSFVTIRQAIDGRRKRAAWGAPGGSEIDEDGDLAVDHFLLPVGGSQFDNVFAGRVAGRRLGG